MGKLFGTDGVRGIANEQLTPELAFKLGRAVALQVALKEKNNFIAIGKDTRISGDMLEAALTAGICSAGVNVYKLGVLPTPGISYLTRKLGAVAGAVISASHNPMQDNGIKFFNHQGYKLSDELESEVEQAVFDFIDGGGLRPVGSAVGKVIEIADAEERYGKFLISTFDGSLEGLRIVLDCANGAAYQVAPHVLIELGAEVILFNAKPNGSNINKNCGSTHMEKLPEIVRGVKADLAIAHDGDADRVLMIDENGKLIDGDQIMMICAKHIKEKGLLDANKLVVTVMSNLGLKQAAKRLHIDLAETQVGDRYVLEEMLKCGAMLGGEQSGHIIFHRHNTTGDGVLTALQLLQVMIDDKKPLSVLAKCMEVLPQILINVPVKNKQAVLEKAEFLSAIAEAEAVLGDAGRILVRPSGTESLIRIMVEGNDQLQINAIAEELAEIIR
ncbi:MAG: phosphoglucosamine mutase [Clostridia bacterium]